MNTNHNFEEQDIRGVYLIKPFPSSDLRGMSLKDFSEEEFRKNNICFCPKEILTIRSKKGVLRGIHFQKIKGQAKLIHCISGKLWCVVADINKNSATFGQWISVDVNEGTEIYVPGNCAVGTLALEETFMLYACDERYYREYEDGIRWDDIDLGIEWPLQEIGGGPILSEKDKNLGSFARLKTV